MMFWSLLAAWSFFAAIRHTVQPPYRRTMLRWHILLPSAFHAPFFLHEEMLLYRRCCWRRCCNGWAYGVARRS
jgi:hypothetical protein